MTEYRFYREKTGQWETVEPELWRWEAHYDDGTVLKQFDDEGVFHQFREINQDNLSHFDMVCIPPGLRADQMIPPIILQWKEGRKLIHFYLHGMKVPMNEAGEITEIIRHKIYCFGYEEKEHKVICMIMPDGSLIITDDHNRIKQED